MPIHVDHAAAPARGEETPVLPVRSAGRDHRWRAVPAPGEAGDPDEVPSHLQSVGRALAGTIHITDDGTELPPGEIDTVWLGGNDALPLPGRRGQDPIVGAPLGWRIVGDLGRLDDEGYLYLAGRRDQLIISGGVNIHPQKAEDVLALHHAVGDIAVIGAPDEEYGQIVRAVIVPARGATAGGRADPALP
jgi:acyl-CoA synthetase (AMP-forming)/AMP-acid ligase II